MRKLVFVSVLMLSSRLMMAQEAQFSSIDTVVHQFYAMLSEDNAEKRSAAMAALFTKTGQISSVNHHPNQPASVKSGSWRDFAAGSSALYNSFFIANDEVERNVDFYQDIASINGLVYQTLSEKTTSKKYAQLYWIQLELVFLDNRWYIDYASWTNRYQNSNVEDAVLTDTIWHQISR